MSPGDIDNGRRVPVDFGFYRGTAGARIKDGVGEAACLANLPSGQVQVSGTVNGHPVQILSMRRSDTAEGMLVVSFVPLPDAAA